MLFNNNVMKSSEACKLLQITKPTLYKYKDNGLLKASRLPNGYWDFDEESVYSFFNKDVPRKIYAYARVSTNKQKKDLENQIQLLKNWCFSNGIQLNGLFSDIASGISFEKRNQFFLVLDEIIQKKVKRIIITYKDRLSRVGFGLFSHLFRQFGCEITIISEVGNEQLDSKEVMEEIISLMHCFAMKMYSKRKKPLIQQLISQEGV